MPRAVVFLASSLLLAACFTTTADFKNDAERFILENQQLSESVDATFTTAACEEPERQDVGTSFPCTAIDDQGRSWEFSIEITSSSEYEVNITRFP